MKAFPGLEGLMSVLGVEKLYPPQEEALALTAEGQSLVLALSTAAGKSLVAYANLLRAVEQGRKGLYIVPLRALAAEKYRELKELALTLEGGCRVGLAMGDYDTPAGLLGRYDLLVATSEKVDSLLRARAPWLTGLGCVVADEVHLLHDRKRGPALEVTLARLRTLKPGLQILALSATVANSAELAAWLGAQHLASQWRPVALAKATCHGQSLSFDDGHEELLEGGGGLTTLVGQTLKGGGQLLVFTATRRNAEAQARNLQPLTASLLDKGTARQLAAAAKELEESQAEATSTTATVAAGLRAGVAFHHAGLAQPHREALEAAYRARLLKVIVATPTLAAGVNLPAQRVIVRDLKRYDFDMGGQAPLPVLEVQQMMGRAGRPGYDQRGEAILMVKDEAAGEAVRQRYLKGEPEPIVSQLASQAALRTHLLAAIAAEYCTDQETLQNFLASTFYGHQEELWRLKGRVEKVLDFLAAEGLIAREGGGPVAGEFAAASRLNIPELFEATEFGAKVSQLYLDPKGAVILRQALKAADPTLLAADKARAGLELGLLHALCTTPDMNRLFARKTERYDLLGTVYDNEDYLLLEAPVDDFALEEYLGAFKTALLLRAWANEAAEDQLVENYGVGPGDIRYLTDTAQWLLHATAQLAKLERKALAPFLQRLCKRVAYGCSEDLLGLIEALEGVGRVRARTLYRAGFTGLAGLAAAEPAALAELPGIGGVLAERIVAQARRAAR